MDPSYFSGTINRLLPEPQASLLNGIIFGLPIRSTGRFFQELKMVGLLHLVVLSGMNITLLGTLIMTFSRNFSKWLSVLITILLIILFVLFVRPQAPVVRAAFIGIITLVSFIFGRKSVSLYSLFLSFLFIAILWPHWLKTLSLQLSYGASLGLLFFARFDETEEQKGIYKIFSYMGTDFRTSIAAQVFTVPLIFLHFRQISLIAPVTNVLVSFLVAPLMMFGFLTAILGKINVNLAVVPATVCFGLLTYMIWVIKTVARLPYIFLDFN